MILQQALDHALRHHQAGRWAEAEAAYRQILAANPADPTVHLHLAQVYASLGRRSEAILACRQALHLNPDDAATYNYLGILLDDDHQIQEATVAFCQAIRLQPGSAEARNNLGIVLTKQNRLDEGIASYRQAIVLLPTYARAHSNLGVALARKELWEDAAASLRRALELDDHDAEAWNNLGNILKNLGKLDDAIACYNRALGIAPDYALATYNLGNALLLSGAFGEAVAAYRRAIQLNPGYPDAYLNLGNALKEQAALAEAIAVYRHGRTRFPTDSRFASNLIFALLYDPAQGSSALVNEQRQWNQNFCRPLRTSRSVDRRAQEPDRRLRIGYVSPDLNQHVVGRTLLPVFQAHDPSQVETFCYAGPVSDPVAQRFQASAAQWRNMQAWNDAQLADQIRADAIDILVDLSLHTAGNRLLAFARKPAVIQVSWLGYPGSSGVETIDYYLTDRFLDPPSDENLIDRYGQPFHLPNAWSCYPAPDDAPGMSPLPALATGAVTFASFNNFAKISNRVLALWARVLLAVPQSRLRLLVKSSSQQDRVRALLQAEGIAPNRIDFVPHVPLSSKDNSSTFLSRYAEVDIALDPFPYNGMTTTGDALWMGVPVVALRGNGPVSRASFSLLSNLGLSELVASTEDEYVRIASDLANDFTRLANLRATLRGRMEASPLLDFPGFARNLEAAFRDMWQHWCAAQG